MYLFIFIYTCSEALKKVLVLFFLLTTIRIFYILLYFSSFSIFFSFSNFQMCHTYSSSSIVQVTGRIQIFSVNITDLGSAMRNSKQWEGNATRNSKHRCIVSCSSFSLFNVSAPCRPIWNNQLTRNLQAWEVVIDLLRVETTVLGHHN